MAVEIRVPTLGESVTEATVANWLKKPGDAVVQDEPLVELETDKVTVEVPAPSAGVLGQIAAQVGATVGVGALLATVDAAGKPAPQPAAAPAAPPPAAAAPVAAAPVATGRQAGPAARKLAAETGVDLAQVAGSGKDGRPTKADIAAYQPPASVPAQAPVAAPAAATVPSGPRDRAEREERVRMSRLRQTIAKRLKHAQETAAMLTTFNEVDMSQVMALRARHKDEFEKKHGVRLGFMSFFAKASVLALREFPAVNAEIDGTDIVYKNYYDLGVAVSTPNGLVVPVVRDCDAKSFATIEREIGEFGVRARDGKLSLEELTGGTFTITNGGVFGSLMSTPILNAPQSAVLGMHKTMERPVAIAGKVEIRPMMYLALSYDHRIIDGREAVSFLVRVKDAIEAPERLLFDL